MEPGRPDLHAVTLWVRLRDREFVEPREQMTVYALADRVMTTLEASGAGTYDTNDLERGFFRIYLYGPDADAIVAAVRPVLTGLPAGSYVAKRAGPVGTSEERVALGD